MKNVCNIYSDDNLSHYVIINKLPPMNIECLNIYNIIYCIFKILKTILYSLNHEDY